MNFDHFFKTGLEETFKHYDETGSNEDCPRKVRARVPSAAEEKFNRVTSTSDWQHLRLEPCEGPRRAGSLFSVIGAVPDTYCADPVLLARWASFQFAVR